MASDRDFVSTEEHELNYILKKYEKRQSKENREKIVNALKDFKNNPEYKPHNRERFYSYLEEKEILSNLE